MVILLSLLFFSLQSAEVNLLPHIDKTGKPVLPELSSSYIKTIMTNEGAYRERRDHLFNLMRDNATNHMSLYTHFQQKDPRERALAPLEKYSKKQSINVKDLQQKLYPTFYFQKCVHPSCPFTPSSVHESYVQQAVETFQTMLQTPGKNSFHIIDFASGRLLTTSRIMLKIFQSLETGLVPVSNPIAIQLHCVDPIYSTEKPHEAFPELMNRMKNSFDVLMEQGRKFSPAVDFKPTKWYTNTASIMPLLTTINRLKSAAPDRPTPGILVQAIDFQEGCAFLKRATYDLQELVTTLPEESRTVVCMENERDQSQPPIIHKTKESTLAAIATFHRNA